MTTSTKAKQTKAINEAVKAYYTESASLDSTAMILSQNGINFTDIQKTIEKIGIDHEWLLTPAKIEEKVESTIKGQTVSHFLDIVKLSKKLEIPQLTQAEKQNAIVEFGNIEKSIAKEPMKFKRLHNSGNHGKIAAWIKENPEFTPAQLHSSGLVTASNAADYYDEFLAYREFFRA